MANGVTSEWEDVHVKLGNYLPREKEPTNEEIFQAAIEKESQKDPNAGKSLEQIRIEREENLDDDDDEILKEYERKRLEELKEFASKPKFGQLREINRKEYVDEVNNAPKGVFVVLFLYEDGNMDSAMLERILNVMTKKFVLIKFLKIRATNCIEGIEENNIPGMLIYKDGEMVRQFIPATVYFGGKGKMDIKSNFLFNFYFLF